jgi:hypothetical protein
MKNKRIKKVSGGLSVGIEDGTSIKGKTSFVAATETGYKQKTTEERGIKESKTRFGFL